MTAVRIQALYFLFMGLWPLLHMPSFQAVTGPKVDTWLVRSIAWLFIVIAVQLWVAAEPWQVAVIGIGSAAVIGGADLYYGLQHRISRVYLLDAVPQAVFVIGWLVYLLS